MPSRVGAAIANNCGVGTSANPTFTLPGSIPNGSKAVLVVCNSAFNALTLAGWTITGPFDNGSAIRSWIISKDVNSGDSGATITLTLASSKWAIAGGVYSDPRGIDLTITPAQNTTLVGTFTGPTFTLAESYELALEFVAGQRPFANTDGVASWTQGFTGAAGTWSNTGSGSEFEAAFAEKDMGTTTGAQSAPGGTWNGNSRANTYVVTLTAANVAISPNDAGTGSISQNAAVAAALDAADTGTGVDTATVTFPGFSGADTGAGVDVTDLAAAVAAADNGASISQTAAVAPALAAADTAAGVDVATVTFPPFIAADTGTFVDLAAPLITPKSAADTGHGTDIATLVKSRLIQFRSNTPTAAALHNPAMGPGEPGWDGDGIRVGAWPDGSLWNDEAQTVMEGHGTFLTKTTSYAVGALDRLIIVNGSSITITLPDPATVVPGRRYLVKNIHTTSLTVATAAGTIDGAATATLAQWAKTCLVSDGTNWLTI